MFTDRQRRIFHYHDGTQEVLADPGEIDRRLWEHSDGKLGVWVESWTSADRTTRYAAEKELYQAACYAFDMQPFDKKTGEGVLLDEALAVLESFLHWLAAKKNSTASAPPLATSSPASADPPQVTMNTSA